MSRKSLRQQLRAARARSRQRLDLLRYWCLRAHRAESELAVSQRYVERLTRELDRMGYWSSERVQADITDGMAQGFVEPESASAQIIKQLRARINSTETV